MRRSSPSQVDAGAVGRRHRRARAASGAAARPPTPAARSIGRVTLVAARGRPSRRRTVASAGGGPLGVDVVADRRRRARRAPPASEHAELAALGRLERAERAPQQRHDVRRTRRASATTIQRVDDRRAARRRARSTVPLPARKPSTNAAPVGRRRARRQRPAEPGARRRPASQCPRRAAAGSPGPARARARAVRRRARSSTAGQLAVARRVVDERRAPPGRR